MKLCVYAIMRDERLNVADWVSTADTADDIFVLDTGSVDGTAEALEDLGVIVRRARFAPFRFDDARNAALALAPDADLYLRLDADERLPDGWRFIIEDAFDPTIPRYSYRVHNNGGIWDQIVRDDLHQRAGFRWKYPTHEVLTGHAATRDLPDLIVQHTSPPERRDHHHTNLEVLQSAVYEYPGDHRMHFYLAREFYYTNQWDFCRKWMSTFLALPDGWAPERAEAYRILASIDYHPERWLWKAIGECPQRREPWVDLTRHFLGTGDLFSAALVAGLAAQRTDETIYTTDPEAWGPSFDALLDRVRALELAL